MTNPKFKIRNWKFIRTGFSSQSGVALLPIILVLFGLVAVVGVALASISISEFTISSTKDSSDEALIIAQSGLEDVLMKIARNKDFTSTGYSLSVSGGNATIVVSGTSRKTISSAGALNNKSRKIQAIVDVDSNGKITHAPDWWQEVAP